MKSDRFLDRWFKHFCLNLGCLVSSMLFLVVPPQWCHSQEENEGFDRDPWWVWLLVGLGTPERWYRTVDPVEQAVDKLFGFIGVSLREYGIACVLDTWRQQVYSSQHEFMMSCNKRNMNAILFSDMIVKIWLIRRKPNGSKPAPPFLSPAEGINIRPSVPPDQGQQGT